MVWDAWSEQSQTSGYLPSCRTSLPLDRYQLYCLMTEATLLSKRGTAEIRTRDLLLCESNALTIVDQQASESCLKKACFTVHRPQKGTTLVHFSSPNPTQPTHHTPTLNADTSTVEPIFLHVRWWNKHPVSGCDWPIVKLQWKLPPTVHQFEPNTSPAFFCKTTIACTLSLLLLWWWWGLWWWNWMCYD